MLNVNRLGMEATLNGLLFSFSLPSNSSLSSLCAQVSHHPPALAMIAEHKDWTLWQEYTVGSKFRGNYLQCSPIGCLHLVFHRTGNHYTWTKVVITIRNLVVGKPWVDNVSLQMAPLVSMTTTLLNSYVYFHTFLLFVYYQWGALTLLFLYYQRGLFNFIVPLLSMGALTLHET